MILDGAIRSVVTRGGVYWIGLDKRRPCVVVSSPDVLRVDIWQTHVVPLTSNLLPLAFPISARTSPAMRAPCEYPTTTTGLS